MEVIRRSQSDIDVPPAIEEIEEQLGETYARESAQQNLTFTRVPAPTSWNRGKNWNYRKGNP